MDKKAFSFAKELESDIDTERGYSSAPKRDWQFEIDPELTQAYQSKQPSQGMSDQQAVGAGAGLMQQGLSGVSGESDTGTAIGGIGSLALGAAPVMAMVPGGLPFALGAAGIGGALSLGGKYFDKKAKEKKEAELAELNRKIRHAQAFQNFANTGGSIL